MIQSHLTDAHAILTSAIVVNNLLQVSNVKCSDSSSLQTSLCDDAKLREEWNSLLESSKTEISFINPPRTGCKLLVLDLDHTLLHFSKHDHVSAAEMTRPHMDIFLNYVYSYG
jgi:hypothetical protein